MPDIDRQQELQRRAKEEKKKKKKKTLDDRVKEIDTDDWSTFESQKVLGKN